MRSRPSVQLRTTSPARPGGRLDVSVELTSTSETPVDFIDLRLTGREIVSSGDDELTHTHLSIPPPLHGPTTLARGTRSLRAAFTLPVALPPSYASERVSVRYALEVVVSIPWWPDVDEA